jgi:chromosomal replication initiator protein
MLDQSLDKSRLNPTPSLFSGENSSAQGAASAAVPASTPAGGARSNGAPDSAPHHPENIIDAAWQEVMDVLQAELSAPAYNNYLRHIRPLDLSGQYFTLGVPSEFVKDWLVRRFAKRIEETLEQFLGQPTTLLFRTGPDEKPSVPTVEAPVEGLSLAPIEQQAAQLQEVEAQSAPEAPPFAPPAPSPTMPAPKRARDLSDLEDFSSSPLNRKYTFDNFIVGRSNYISHAAAWAVANAPAKGQYNPLFIYGGVGLGKTHLMQAIGHHVNKSRGNPAEIVYVSGENFLYQVVRCIREDRMTAFRRMYRNVDIWLVDDIQYICNAERTEVEFFHIFNTLYDQGKQIVICSDKPPKDLQLTESRLVSRFEWGLITYVEPPDLEHRIAILQKRAQVEGVQVAPEVLQYLAEKVRSNIRSLEGALTRLLAMSSLDGRKINLDLAAETVRYYSTAEAEPVKVDVQTIIEVVAEQYKMAVDDILGKKRNKEIVMPRQVAMYLAREMGGMSYPDIGRAFGRDYTTVIHSYEKIKNEVKRDSNLKNLISEIRSRAHARA